MISWEPCVAEISDSWFQGTFLQPTTFRGFVELNSSPSEKKNNNNNNNSSQEIRLPVPLFLVPRSEQRFDGKRVIVRILMIVLLEKQVENLFVEGYADLIWLPWFFCLLLCIFVLRV